VKSSLNEGTSPPASERTELRRGKRLSRLSGRVCTAPPAGHTATDCGRCTSLGGPALRPCYWRKAKNLRGPGIEFPVGGQSSTARAFGSMCVEGLPCRPLQARVEQKSRRVWIPACAGMTRGGSASLCARIPSEVGSTHGSRTHPTAADRQLYHPGRRFGAGTVVAEDPWCSVRLRVCGSTGGASRLGRCIP
jgi:hypothetical protein